MKKLTKLLALLLVFVLAFALTACGTNYAELYAGDWYSEQDCTDSFLEGISAEMGAEEYIDLFLECCQFKDISIRYVLTLSADGTFTYGADPAAWEKTVDTKVMPVIEDGYMDFFYAMMEEELLKEYTEEELADTYAYYEAEDLVGFCTALGYETVDDVLADIDMSMEDIRDLEIDAFNDYVGDTLSGTFKANKEGVVLTDSDSGVFQLTFDADAGTFTDVVDEIVYTRA